MDGSGECAGIRSQLGVYLTGAIGPADREAVVRHLAGCENCRAELAGLAALPALLRRPDVAAAAQPPADDLPGDDAAPPKAGKAQPKAGKAQPKAGKAQPKAGKAQPESGEALLTRLLSRVARRRPRHR